MSEVLTPTLNPLVGTDPALLLATQSAQPKEDLPKKKFLLALPKKALEMAADLIAKLVKMIRALVAKIAAILGFNVTTSEQEGGVAVEVDGDVPRQSLEDLRSNAEGVVQKLVDMPANVEEQFSKLDQDFRSLNQSMAAFEKDWAGAHPDLPLEAAIKTNAVPEVQAYVGVREKIKAIVLLASALLHEHPELRSMFDSALLEAVEMSDIDIERTQFADIDLVKLSSEYSAANAKVAAEPEGELRDAALEVSKKLLEKAVKIYQFSSERRSEFSEVLLTDIEASLFHSNDSRELINGQNDSESPFIQSSVSKSTQSNNDAERKVVSIVRRAKVPIPEFSAASHLPGLSLKGSELPVFHKDSATGEVIRKASRFGDLSSKVLDVSQDRTDETPGDRDWMGEKQ